MIATVIVDFLAGGLIAGVAFMLGAKPGRSQTRQSDELERPGGGQPGSWDGTSHFSYGVWNLRWNCTEAFYDDLGAARDALDRLERAFPAGTYAILQAPTALFKAERTLAQLASTA